MRNKLLFFGAIVPWSFLAGLLYSYGSIEPLKVTPKPLNETIKAYVTDDVNMPPIEQFHDTNTEPSPNATYTPKGDTSTPQAINNGQLFTKGEMVTCIYDAVKSWSDGNEFIEPMPMKCKVVDASEPWHDLEPNYQHIQVDCSKDLETKWSSQPGVGLVKDHKLNFKVRWYGSNTCYHFVANN